MRICRRHGGLGLGRQTGKGVGMITMDESLRQLYVQGLISRDETLFRSDDKNQMKAFFES